jgi:hypothetical protein
LGDHEWGGVGRVNEEAQAVRADVIESEHLGEHIPISTSVVVFKLKAHICAITAVERVALLG